MTFDNLLIERDEAVAIVTFNRPKVLNALNTQTLTELASAMQSFKDDPGVRAIVITGAGEKSWRCCLRWQARNMHGAASRSSTRSNSLANR
jgi:enoyl-CoA hydratase/carnithine racemase